MGMKNSSDVFCHRTDDILAGIPDLLKIVDDALLQADSEEELLVLLRMALTACRAGNLTLSKNKVCWGKTVNFAGYIIAHNGVYPDPKRTAAVANFPVPTDLSALRGFLGLVNQLGHFIPDLAHLTVNLREMLKKGVEWQWLPDHQEAFDLCCRVLTSDLVVKPFDKSCKTELLTDASRLKGLGYALIQRAQDGNPRLIQCSSRSLTSAEKNYATIELECLAIAWAIEDCRFYLLGARFEVLTDHKPLEGVFKKPLADLLNPRLLGFRLRLVAYTDFTVIWTEGKTHYIADALSRAPVFDPPERDVPAAVCYNAVVTPRDPLLCDMYAAAEADQAYKSVIKSINQGVAAADLPEGHPGRLLKSVWHDLSPLDDTLLMIDASRIVVPVLYRQTVLKQLHTAHSGITRTRALARKYYFWPGMSNDISTMIDSCEICQLLRASNPTEPMQMFNEPVEPMQTVSIDLWSEGGEIM